MSTIGSIEVVHSAKTERSKITKT